MPLNPNTTDRIPRTTISSVNVYPDDPSNGHPRTSGGLGEDPHKTERPWLQEDPFNDLSMLFYTNMASYIPNSS